MADLKSEYDSMDTAARKLHVAISHLPVAVARFHRAMASVHAFGHLPDAAKAKHTVTQAMTRLAVFGEGLQAEWEAESKALSTIAEVLKQVDTILTHQARSRLMSRPAIDVVVQQPGQSEADGSR